MNNKGSTFTEMLVPMSLIALLVGHYAVTSLSLNTVSLESAGKRIQSDLRYAQQLAMTTGVKHGAIFQSGTDSYEVYRNNSATPAMDPVTRQGLVVDMSNFAGVSIANDRSIEFDSTGSPLTATNTFILLLASNGDSKGVCVIKNTGVVLLDTNAATCQ